MSDTQISDAENGFKCLTVTKLCNIAEALEIEDERKLYKKVKE